MPATFLPAHPTGRLLDGTNGGVGFARGRVASGFFFGRHFFFPSSRASSASSAAAARMQRLSMARRASLAQVCVSAIRVFPGVPSRSAVKAGASAGRGGSGRVHLEGSLINQHPFTFVSCRSVRRLVRAAIVSINPHTEAPVGTQIEMPLLQRMEGPDVVPTSLVHKAKTYRQAVRLCWGLRRVKWTPATLSAHYGFTRQHVGDWINPDDKLLRRSLPAERIPEFEEACGNVLLTQWLAARQHLTVLEEIQASRLQA